MAIKEALEELDTMFIPEEQTKFANAYNMAVASMKALEEIRQEAMDAIEDGLYVRNTRILDIIDKYLKEDEQNV